MWAATAWDTFHPEAPANRGWSVMGRLRDRQQHAAAAGARVRRGNSTEDSLVQAQLMMASSMPSAWRSSTRTVWTGGPFVVALLFAHPDSAAIGTLDARGAYFEVRTGDSWDLFFPGYHKADNPDFEREAGGQPVGRDFARHWFFNPRDFDAFRRYVERASGGRWVYSGGTDLVLVTGYMPSRGEIIIDWKSTMVGSLTEPNGHRTLTIEQVIERLSTDLETDAEDRAYGLSDVVAREVAKQESRAARDIIVAALGGIAAALARSGLGL